jgi:2,4-dienoyl-CoA reductase-like NADH-dependent reductase (Old Yellow Enzyme family)
MQALFDSVTFKCGRRMKNRFMLSPMTNLQSHEDGVLSDEEFNWLTLRARGGFGLTVTCAAHVQAAGQGFPGQLGIFSDRHLPGLTRLASAIRQEDSLGLVQLHHAGMRSPAELIKTQPLCPSDNEKTGARAMSAAEVAQVTEDFISAAERAEKAGFDGVELHAAHGYLIGQFLSAEINRREDNYGGNRANRFRLLADIIEGVRRRCRSDFILAVRLSPERFGMRLEETIKWAAQLMQEENIDLLDMSLWDTFKKPADTTFGEQDLLSCFTGLERHGVRLAVAGNIRTPAQAQAVIEAGVDVVALGRAAILHHDFPERCRTDSEFRPVDLPVSRDYLAAEGLSPKFIDYMTRWEGFVRES